MKPKLKAIQVKERLLKLEIRPKAWFIRYMKVTSKCG
jgi:hypothetical protein